VLLAFFAPSVALSRIGKARKRELVDIGKAGARDALQVLANGGVATICAVIWAFTHDFRWALAFAGAFAAATADTWATEIGTLARRAPRSILTLRPLTPGMSGGVTLRGTLAEIAGALWIGIVAPFAIAIAYIDATGSVGYSTSYAHDFGPSVALGVVVAVVVLVITLAGVIGSTADSLLGATLQELRRCDACDRTCETNPHVCGQPTRLIRGIRGVSNDAVNLAATLIGAAGTIPLFALVQHIATLSR
jgi:uncharacterized membrane protein